jgi:2-C-methyl-D-erythritol 2,4-cyclodiphosphate synthase
MGMRIGFGMDTHAFADKSAGRKLMLGGVEVPYERGLIGHSDADVIAHAVTDAILGAARIDGAEDIGAMFPDSDPAYKDADSMSLLRGASDVVASHGFRVVDIDCTVVAQEPKLAQYRDSMRSNVARAIGLDASNVGVKATTTEHLGFEGRGEGISAYAVALLSLHQSDAPLRHSDAPLRHSGLDPESTDEPYDRMETQR